METKDFAKIISYPGKFFREGGIRQTILRNTFWLGLSEAVSQILKLVLIIFVVRVLGDYDYGRFSFALAFTGLFIFISDFGIRQILTREFSKDTSQEKNLSSLLSLRLVLAFLTFFICIAFSFFITQDEIIQKAIWILALMVLANSISGIFFGVLAARQKMEYESWIKILDALVVTVLGFLILFKWPSVTALSLSYFMGAFIALVSILIFFHRKIFPISLGLKFDIWKTYLQLSWPLAFIGIFAVIYNQIDSVMMGCWGMIRETGWYNAAYKVSDGIMIAAALVSQAFFPSLSIAWNDSKEKFKKIFNDYLQLTIIMAFPIVVGGIVLSEKIIIFLYKDASFLPAVSALKILLLMSGIVYFNYTFSRALIVANLQKKIFLVTFGGALFNVILNFILIPRYSLYGAALSTLLSFILMFFLFVFFYLKHVDRRLIEKNLFKTLLAAITASLAMYFALNWQPIFNLHILLAVMAGGVAYLLTFTVLLGLNRFLKVR